MKNEKLQLLDSNDIRKYQLLSIRNLLKTFEVAVVTNKSVKISNKLTKEYKKFVNEASFESIKYAEYKIEENNEEIIKLKKGIHHYCTSGDYKKIKLYVNLGFDVNVKDNEHSQTPLQYATSNGHYNIVKLLVDNGADANIHKKGFENAYLAAKRLGYKRSRGQVIMITHKGILGI